MSEAIDLGDPATRENYRRQLRTLARPMRVMAFVMMLTGVAVAVIPGVPRAVALLVVGLGLVQLVAAIAMRHGIGPKPRRR